MKQLAWGDLLCGVPVTPEAWWNGYGREQTNGLVEHTGNQRWYQIEQAIRFNNPHDDGCYWSMHLMPLPGEHEGMPHVCREEFSRPIFPPTGFAGKTDAELWEAVYGDGSNPLHDGDFACVTLHSNSRFSIVGDCGDCVDRAHPDELPALILALQNAQVLAARLKEAT